MGIGVLGGYNATTFNNTDFEPTDIGLYVRLGKQASFVRTYLSYSYIDHFGDDDDWVKKGDKKYKATSHVFSFNADLMPKLPSSPLYGILGFDIGWERLNLEYEDERRTLISDLWETRLINYSHSINGLNLGVKAGLAVEITPNFQLELTGRVGTSILQKIELRDNVTREIIWNNKPKQSNFTGMLGITLVF